MNKKQWFLFGLVITVAVINLSGQVVQKDTDSSWYKYPSYGAYVGFLEKWESDYPALAKVYDLGPSMRDLHRIYAIRISDNVTQNEAEPRYIQTATVHGQEVLNYMLTLHMIDTLLASYGNDERITDLVNTLELWFCPLVNPDITYWTGDSIINFGPVNFNKYDLDRNWPCSCMQHPM